VRTAMVVGLCLALAVGACSSSKKATPAAPSTTVSSSTTTVATSSSRATTTSAAPTTTVARPTPTTVPCTSVPTPITPVKGPATTQAALLTNVAELGDRCLDHVVFDFTGKGTDPPGYTVTYGVPPFLADASGAVVPVAGSAFVTVRISPGYGYDYETGRTTYNGPKSVPIAHTNHVRAIVETGDNEGVLNWVIGLDVKRPFSVHATGTPVHQLDVIVG
jgi:hypothetical protein